MATAPTYEDMHEWISFEDPSADRTWVFDVTFLTSNWTCIYGRGCQGVLTEDATDLVQGCCSYGAHFVDDDDVATVVESAKRLTDEQWQFKKKADKKGWLDVAKDGTKTTRVVKGACIFLNRPDFAGGPGCALHSAAVAVGERPLDWKPDVCWQLPLRLQEHTDDHGHVTSTLREWKRRDWGDGGREFHWWCTETHEAFVDAKQVWHTLADEIREMVGSEAFALLEAHLTAQKKSKRLPHPALRVVATS
jgi:hypothetical protein